VVVFRDGELLSDHRNQQVVVAAETLAAWPHQLEEDAAA
jgi:hypothetical protein